MRSSAHDEAIAVEPRRKVGDQASCSRFEGHACPVGEARLCDRGIEIGLHLGQQGKSDDRGLEEVRDVLAGEMPFVRVVERGIDSRPNSGIARKVKGGLLVRY